MESQEHPDMTVHLVNVVKTAFLERRARREIPDKKEIEVLRVPRVVTEVLVYKVFRDRLDPQVHRLLCQTKYKNKCKYLGHQDLRVHREYKVQEACRASQAFRENQAHLEKGVCLVKEVLQEEME